MIELLQVDGPDSSLGLRSITLWYWGTTICGLREKTLLRLLAACLVTSAKQPVTAVVCIHSRHFICRLRLGQEHLALHQHSFLLHLLLQSLIIFKLMVTWEEVCTESAFTLLTHKIWSCRYLLSLYPLIWRCYSRSLLIFHGWCRLLTVAKVVGSAQIKRTLLWCMLLSVMSHLIDVERPLARWPIGAYLCLSITLHLRLRLAIYFLLSVFYFLTFKHFDIFWDYIVWRPWPRTTLIILKSHRATMSILLHSILKL